MEDAEAKQYELPTEATQAADESVADRPAADKPDQPASDHSNAENGATDGLVIDQPAEEYTIQSETAEPFVDVEALLTEGQGDLDDLTTENKVLERSLLCLQRRRSSIGTKLFLEGADSLLQTRLSEWAKAKNDMEMLVLEYDERMEKLQQEIEEKQAEAKAFREDFLAYRWQISIQAEDSITGKPISVKILEKMQNEETKLDEEIEDLRVEEKRLYTRLMKLEQALGRKDELPGGLHLVDYEQLKVENDSLNEKLSKKNSEVAELRKKTTHIVHVLTHYREKLKQAQRETQAQAKALGVVDTELLAKRKELFKTKAKCKSIRYKIGKIQDSTIANSFTSSVTLGGVYCLATMDGNIQLSCWIGSSKERRGMTFDSSVTLIARIYGRINVTLENAINVMIPSLLDDLEVHKENVEAYEKQIEDLKSQYFAFIKRIKELRPPQSARKADPVVSPRTRWPIKRHTVTR